MAGNIPAAEPVEPLPSWLPKGPDPQAVFTRFQFRLQTLSDKWRGALVSAAVSNLVSQSVSQSARNQYNQGLLAYKRSFKSHPFPIQLTGIILFLRVFGFGGFCE